MKINVKESTIVRPAHDTPETSLWVSNLDLLVPTDHVYTVYFYKANGSSSSFDVQVLKEALSKVLVPFYPVAGRLGRDENGRIQIECNGEGVLLVEAETTSVIDDIGDFTPGLDMLQFVPKLERSDDITSCPLLLAQLTRFGCGGGCIGVGMHHTVVDATAAYQFINSWSDTARGFPLSVPPFIDRSPLVARDPPRPTCHHVEYDPPPASNTSAPQRNHKAVAKILHITTDQLDALKTKFKRDDGTSKYTTYETLAAHTWRCMCKARELPETQPTRLYIPTDGRSRLCPPLPPGFFGNVVFTTAITSISREVESEPMESTVRRIHEALKRRDDEYLRSALDYLQLQPDLEALKRGAQTFRCPNLNVVSWMRLPVYEANFGWGRPFFVGPASVGFEGMGYLMPRPHKGEGVNFVLFLDPNQAEHFQKLFYEF
ncbi:hypothetical protein K2173_015894 [Erythroxylum novogranatense]|uniref:Uncharacterized protein n=1 Tax=Erythroxylum novogranatense TaxID=1862640 RepID=A0AAV8SF89_9ROSI|nr:hypothetical protein K2173_015894 [Erythroxylum novogranatense]